MAKIGIRLPITRELRILTNIDSYGLEDDFVVYEEERSLYCSKAILLPETLTLEREYIKEANFLRSASSKDKSQMLEKREEETRALNICNKKIKKNNLPMRLIDATYTFDFNRLTFFFSSPGRVDFRLLLKDLTPNFKRTRIMLRQIGAREEARIFDGVGSCGRQLCCSSWLTKFPFVTMDMVRNQNLPHNPSKLTGLCGKLKCCLSYENDFYTEEKATMPRKFSYIETEKGIAKVLKLFPLKNELKVVYYEDNKYDRVKIKDILARDLSSPEEMEDEFSALDDL